MVAKLSRQTRIDNLPEDAVKTVDGEIVIYLYRRADNKFCAMGFSSARKEKPDFFFHFPSEENRAAHIARWKNTIQGRIAAKNERKEQAKINATVLNVGDILYTSRGYNMTTVTFYQVTRVTKASVEIRKVASEIVSTYADGGTRIAKKDEFVGEPMMKRVNDRGVTMDGYSTAYPWDGRPVSYTDMD